MKIRILDRILVAVAGLILVAACAALIAQAVFQVDVTGAMAQGMQAATFWTRAGLTLVALGLLALGIYCILMLFRRRRRKDHFVIQRNDIGELAISMQVMDQMVRKCLAEHSELAVRDLEMENRKDGLVVRISGDTAGGISIPLTIETLQKHIKQYVTACSGVEISSVEVEIETSGEDAADAAFAIPTPAMGRLPRQTAREEKAPEPEHPEMTQEHPVESAGEGLEQKTDKAAASEAGQPAAGTADNAGSGSSETKNPATDVNTAAVSAAAGDAVGATPAVTAPAAAAVEAAEAEAEDGDERPMHQRLFSSQPELCIMPEPPTETETLPAADTNDREADEEAASAESAPVPAVDSQDDDLVPMPESGEGPDAEPENAAERTDEPETAGSEGQTDEWTGDRNGEEPAAEEPVTGIAEDEDGLPENPWDDLTLDEEESTLEETPDRSEASEADRNESV